MKTTVQIIILMLLSNILSAKTDVYPGMVKLITGWHKFAKGADSTVTFLGLTTSTAKDISNYKSDTVVFNFYRNPKDNKVYRHLSFYFDWSKIPRIVRIVEKNYTDWLSPMTFNDDTSGYYDIYFTCKSKKGNWLEIIINEGTQETAWIRDTKFVKMLPWKNLLKEDRFLTIELKDFKTTQYFKLNDIKSEQINYAENNCFEIVDVKGNWMKIENGDSEICFTTSNKTFTAWVLFKSNDNLVIKVNRP
ncbi:MAG: hypothetical protein V4549_13910 [Bacteroidota bacterium]